MDRDRKSGPLKALQGRIWEQGYATGALKGEVYPDVPEAFARWTAAGVRIGIFSSGSVLAQKLLFANSTAGDLSRFLSGYFDTAVGAKREAVSYRRIVEALRLAAVTRALRVGRHERTRRRARGRPSDTARVRPTGAASRRDRGRASSPSPRSRRDAIAFDFCSRDNAGMKDLAPQTIELESEKVQFLQEMSTKYGARGHRQGRAVPRELRPREPRSARRHLRRDPLPGLLGWRVRLKAQGSGPSKTFDHMLEDLA